MSVMQEDDGDWVVQATATDASYLFPSDMKLIEVVGTTDFHRRSAS